jgi:hypothetical protein
MEGSMPRTGISREINWRYLCQSWAVVLV